MAAAVMAAKHAILYVMDARAQTAARPMRFFCAFFLFLFRRGPRRGKPALGKTADSV